MLKTYSFFEVLFSYNDPAIQKMIIALNKIEDKKFEFLKKIEQLNYELKEKNIFINEYYKFKIEKTEDLSYKISVGKNSILYKEENDIQKIKILHKDKVTDLFIIDVNQPYLVLEHYEYFTELEDAKVWKLTKPFCSNSNLLFFYKEEEYSFEGNIVYNNLYGADKFIFKGNNINTYLGFSKKLKMKNFQDMRNLESFFDENDLNAEDLTNNYLELFDLEFNQ